METLFIFFALYVGFVLVFSTLSYHAIRNDKQLAAVGLPGISEWKLHVLEMFGGVLGSYFAQRILQHKVDKMSYQIIYYCLVGFHIAGVLTAIYFRDLINYLQLPCMLDKSSVA